MNQEPYYQSIYSSLVSISDPAPERPAILGSERLPLTFGQLCLLIKETVARLNELGIGRGDAVAVSLPNGPEMAAAFLSIACGAVCAPLNPRYRAAEYDLHLSILKPRALITLPDSQSPITKVAHAREIPLVELHPVQDGPAGCFTLHAEVLDRNVRMGMAAPGEIALMLQTSGTTRKPKIVPLSHCNLVANAIAMRKHYGLTEVDRCLNLMPLFHTGGLVQTLLTGLLSGAPVACPPPFSTAEFFHWMDEFQPAWFTASPTIHQAILAAVEAQHLDIHYPSLRFIRSSSAKLPPPVEEKLRKTFKISIISAYGMTEAAGQITSNTVPPLPGKTHSAGLPVDLELAIMDEDRNLIPESDAVGEVLIRGPQVITSYFDNPEANETNFVNGWLCTGDLGYLDSDGYLFLTGRQKEIINRGGEVISPFEVEAVLLDHPAVAQAVAFAMPHQELGEQVAAAVVLKAPASEKELRQFVSRYLADFKTPHMIVFLDEIPKGPTHKKLRIGLAEKLDLVPPEDDQKSETYSEIRREIEKILAVLWAEVLSLPAVRTDQRFLDLGGDSILATRLVARIRRHLEIEFTLMDFFDAPTITDQARILEKILIR